MARSDETAAVQRRSGLSAGPNHQTDAPDRSTRSLPQSWCCGKHGGKRAFVPDSSDSATFDADARRQDAAEAWPSACAGSRGLSQSRHRTQPRMGLAVQITVSANPPLAAFSLIEGVSDLALVPLSSPGSAELEAARIACALKIKAADGEVEEDAPSQGYEELSRYVKSRRSAGKDRGTSHSVRDRNRIILKYLRPSRSRRP